MDILQIIIIVLLGAAALIYLLHYLVKKGMFPKVLYKGTDGAVSGKCPECEAVIHFTESEKNLNIFKCDKCGAESKTQ